MYRLHQMFSTLIMVSLLLGLCACGGQPQTAAEPAAASEGQEAEPAGQEAAEAAEPVEVKVLAMQQAGPTPEEMDEIVSKFNDQNPGINVNIEYVSYDALHDKIITAMATNPPSYDVLLVDDIWYAEFVKNGYLWDVSDKIDDNMKENVFEAAWEISSVNGKVYGMPWLLDQMYFYYNADILAEAGFDAPPATWEEMVEQSRVIKDMGLVEYPIVWQWGQIEASICDFVTLLFGNGGTLVDEEGKPSFNSEKGVQVVEWMIQTLDEGISNPASISYGEEDCRNVFSQGKAAFTINWVYMYDLVNVNEEESDITGQVKMSLMPVFEAAAAEGIKSATNNGSMGFSVVDKSPNREQAWEYVRFLTSEAIQKEYSAHLLPVWSNNYEGEALEGLEALNETNPVTVPAFSAQFPYAHVRPKVSYYLEGSKVLQLALQQALTKEKSPAEALDDAAQQWLELQAE